MGQCERFRRPHQCPANAARVARVNLTYKLGEYNGIVAEKVAKIDELQAELKENFKENPGKEYDHVKRQ